MSPLSGMADKICSIVDSNCGESNRKLELAHLTFMVAALKAHALKAMESPGESPDAIAPEKAPVKKPKAKPAPEAKA